MLAMSRDLGTSYKTSFVLAHKIREAMAAEVSQNAIGGVGKKAEIDAGWFEAGQPPRCWTVSTRSLRQQRCQSHQLRCGSARQLASQPRCHG